MTGKTIQHIRDESGVELPLSGEELVELWQNGHSTAALLNEILSFLLASATLQTRAAIEAQLSRLDLRVSNVRPRRMDYIGHSILQSNTQAASDGSNIFSFAVGEVEIAVAMARQVDISTWPDPSKVAFMGGANHGKNADTTAGVRARLSELESQRPDIVAVDVGINSITVGVPLASMQDDLLFIRDTLFSYGAGDVIFRTQTPIDYTVLPNGHAYRAVRVALNSWISNTLCGVPHAHVWDASATYSDPAQPTATPGDFLPKAGSLTDGIHPTPFGAWSYGAPPLREVIYAISPRVKAYADIRDRNILPYVPFSFGAPGAPAGVIGARCTGWAPDGWTIEMAGAGTTSCYCIPVVNADGTYSWSITSTVNAGGQSTEVLWIHPTSGTVPAGSIAGKWASMWIEIDWTNYNAYRNPKLVMIPGVLHAFETFGPGDKMPLNTAFSTVIETKQMLMAPGLATISPSFQLAINGLQTTPPGTTGTFFLRGMRAGEIDNPLPNRGILIGHL